MRIQALALATVPICLAAQSWEPLPDFPGTARDDAAAFAIGAHAYFGTGMEVGWGLTSDWWMLDVAGGFSWTPVPALPAEPRQYCATFSIETQARGFLFGGIAPGGPLNELWSFSELTHSWAQAAPLPAPARYASTAFSIDGKGFIVGGLLADGSATNECWRYDPATDSWAQMASLPGVARHRATSFAYGTFGFVVGGADSAYNALQETWRYDPLVDQWASVAPLPEPRYDAAPLQAAWLLGIVGGASDDTTFHADTYIYNPDSDQWTEMGEPFPLEVRGARGAYAEGGTGYFYLVVGTGLDADLVRRKDMYSYGFVFGVDEPGQAAITISPNPGHEHFTIGSMRSPLQISATDATGRVVYNKRGPVGTVGTNGWCQGLYIITVQDAAGKLHRAPWIKQ